MEYFAGLTDDPAIYLKPLWQAENAIAQRIMALTAIPVAPLPRKMEDMMAQVESRLILALSPEQQTILSAVAKHRISIITGGPGTGKTTLIRSITEMNLRLGRAVCLAAPTGRAARRLAEVTGHKAHTIHKLLEYNFEDQSFGKNPNDPIDADVIIIDETSMVDTVLMHHFIRAVPFRASVILVGDAHQLPPVGPGNVLGDLIAAGGVPVFYLTAIFRQAAESQIIVNAHHVRNGELPKLHPLDEPVDPKAEFYFMDAQTPEQSAAIIVKLCAETLPNRFGLDPVADIQVLSPMHKGVAGTIHLNRELQTALNPSVGVLAHGDQKFKIGDKVIHLKNNYPKDVFNGDIGVISRMDTAEGLLHADFYGREVPYELEELAELALGYTISVHKSQGSEYPAVVMPLLTHHYIMLQRNLLYTAITRARKCVVLVGTKKALAMALKNNTPRLRNSGLAHRLGPSVFKNLTG
jgi:exodeoxyribonuclease V alpha subunit